MTEDVDVSDSISLAVSNTLTFYNLTTLGSEIDAVQTSIDSLSAIHLDDAEIIADVQTGITNKLPDIKAQVASALLDLGLTNATKSKLLDCYTILKLYITSLNNVANGMVSTY